MKFPKRGGVPVLEGDEPQNLTQEELDQGQEDHCWFNHGSTYTTSVFPKDIEDVWFINQSIEDKNLNQKMDLRKQLKNVKIQNA